MKPYTRITGCFALVCFCLGLGGCATMTIKVHAYKGDQVFCRDVQLARAVGTAAFVYAFVSDLYPSMVVDPRHADEKENIALRNALMAVSSTYKEQAIQDQWEKLQSPALTEGQRKEIRKSLAISLARFASACIGAGCQQGLTTLTDYDVRPLRFWRSYLFLWPRDYNRMAGGNTLEIAGRSILSNIHSSVDNSRLSRTAMIMNSLGMGILAAAEMEKSRGIGKDYTLAYERHNWELINTVNWTSAGNAQSVIVKDAVGNWNIKSIKADQNEIFEAAFDSIQAVANVVASRYGVVPYPTTDASDAMVKRSQAQQERSKRAMRAASISQRLAEAKSKFCDDLKAIPTADREAKDIQADMALAVTAYQANLKAIEAAWKQE